MIFYIQLSHFCEVQNHFQTEESLKTKQEQGWLRLETTSKTDCEW